jgi:uncharacterized protein (DUF2062 family)
MDTIETPKTTQAQLEELRQRTENYVREEPTKAVAIALAAGVFLSIFPVFRLFSGVLRLVFALLKPALLILGGVKLYEEYSKRYGE